MAIQEKNLKKKKEKEILGDAVRAYLEVQF
jgi:hypothetical protein